VLKQWTRQSWSLPVYADFYQGRLDDEEGEIEPPRSGLVTVSSLGSPSAETTLLGKYQAPLWRNLQHTWSNHLVKSFQDFKNSPFHSMVVVH
jgi:hypothetical protein